MESREESRRERKFSSESASENPFRDGGKLSRDAQDIVDAVKAGKLATISSKETKDYSEENLSTNGLIEEYNEKESLVKPIIRKNAVIENAPRRSKDISQK